MRKLNLNPVLALLIVFVVSGCAEGTTILTGQKRPAIDPSLVRIYGSPPNANYEVIALVSASSGNGLTDQQSVDFAIQELKNQAAAIGGNGVILESRGSQLGGVVFSGNTAIPYDEQTVSGSAIYVNPNSI